MDSREKKTFALERDKKILKNKITTLLNNRNIKQLSEIASKKSKIILIDDDDFEDSDFNDISSKKTAVDANINCTKNTALPKLLNGDIYKEKTILSPLEIEKIKTKHDKSTKKTISKKSKPKTISKSALMETLHSKNSNLVIAANKLRISNRNKKIRQKIEYKKSVLEVFQHSNKKIKASITSGNAIKTNSICINQKDGNLGEETQNYFLFNAENQVVIVMKPKTKLYFCGKVKASLIKGNVNVLGYALSDQFVPIYSLNNSSLLCFESDYANSKNSNSFTSKLVNLGIEVEKFTSILEKDDSIILLKALDNDLCNFVQDHFNRFKLSTWKNKNNDQVTDVVSNKNVKCAFYNQLSSGIFQHNENWDITIEQILQNRETNNVTFLCGGKGAGKSTFLRYAVNKIISTNYTYDKVLVIDLDPGQPEFTISGVLSATLRKHSVIGPNFTHLQKPNYSVYFGHISVMENEELYLSCVEALFKYCEECKSFKNIPWIVNYMGYVDQSGASLLLSVFEIIKPANVVEIRSHLEKNNYDALPQGPYNHIVLDSYRNEWRPDNNYVVKYAEAKENRLFNILAYFNQLLTSDYNTLLNVPPYSISLDLLQIGLNSLVTEKSRILKTLNGQIVALCQKVNTDDTEENIGNVFTIGEDTVLSCYGYGIVRGIDQSRKKLYLLSPVPKETLALVNVITYSDIWPHMNIFSIINLPINSFVPYTMPTGDRQQHKLMKAPKRRFNLFRLLELKRNK